MKRKSTLLIRFAVRGLMMLGFVFAMLAEVQAQALQVNLPGNYSLCSGGSVPLSPQVSGGVGSYTYTWAPATGLSCTTCPNPIASPQQTTDYTLTVRDLENTEASAMTTVEVAAQPAVSILPASISVCRNETLVLTAITSDGSEPCNVQWQVSLFASGSWIDIFGANGNTLNVSTLEANTYYYRVVYSCSGSGCNQAISNVAQVVVNFSPQVNISPTTSSVCIGGALTLTATPTGGATECSVQWQSSIPGTGVWTNVGTGMTYSVPTVTAGTSYYRMVYSCASSNCNPITSILAEVIVKPTPTISISPSSNTVCTGGSVTLTAMPVNGAGTCTIQWQTSTTLNGPWTTISGATGTTYNTPTATVGTRYYRATYTCTGSGCDAATSNVAAVVVRSAPTISITPNLGSTCVGGTMFLTAIVGNGAGTCTVQWQSGPSTAGPWTNISGANGNTYTAPTSTAGTTYYRATYTCMGSGCNAATSNVATVHVFIPPAPTLSPASQTICTGGLASITLQANGGTGPCGVVWQRSPNGTDGWTTINWSNGTTLEVVGDTEGTAYYRAVYNCNISSCGSTISTVVSVTTTGMPTTPLTLSPESSVVCAGALVTLTPTAGNGSGTCTYRWQNSSGPTGPWSDLIGNWDVYYPATQGWAIGTTTYYRVIYTCTGGFCNTSVSNVVPITVQAIPAVSISPATNFVCQNEPLTLQATVSGGTGNCEIQWLSGPTTNGPWTPVSGAIGVTYLPPTDVPGTMYYTASYGCNGTNCGSITAGQPAKVVTLTPASISVSANDSIVCVGGTPLLTAQLQNGSPECPLQWQRSKFANGPWINIPQANQLTYQVPAGNPDTSFYRVVYACFSNPPSTSGFRLSIDNAAGVVQGQQICLNVTTQNFNNIIGMQFSMQYNPAMLQLTSVSNFGLPGLSAGGSFGLPLAGGAGITAPGTITLTWTDTDWSGETLPNGTTLFTLCFNALANTSAASVAFTVTPTTIEIINTGLQDVPFNSIPGTVYFGSSCYGSISVPVSVTVRPDPAIGLLPESRTVCINSSLTLTTQVSGGAGDCSFQWFSAPGPTGPWTLIPDASGDSYQPPTDQLGLSYYQAVLTCTGSGCGQPASNLAAVLVTDNLFGDEIRATPLACNVWRLSPVLPPDYFGPINALWTLPDGSTSTELQIIATQTGVYQLQISVPASPCQSYLARYINSNADECASIAGYVRHDLDENCQPQTDEPGLANWMARAVGPGGVFHAVTNDEGRYQFSLPLGQYDISLLPPSASWLLCAASYPVSLDQSGQVSQLDIPVKRIRPCPQLEAQLSTLLLRRCFTSTYVVKICNFGTEIAESPVATLVLDNFLSYQSAQRAPSSIQGQTITWELSALAPGQCRQFEVRVLVSCNAALGQSHCSTLSVIPDPLCVPTSPAWSGASLQVSGECTGSQARFRVRNAGTGDLDAPVPCIVIEDVVMLMHQPNTINQLSIGEEAVFDFPANGSTYFFSVGQAPHHPFGNPVTVALEGCGTNDAGTFSTGFVNQLPLQNATTASHTLCLPNIGAYDPNDKQAIPVGYGPEHFIRAGDPLHYKIRFQNTGTDTAFTVIIRDTLSPWLDMATLRPGPSSHDYKVHIDGERTLVFTFDNILLPDSTTNINGSQGFVDFFIQTSDSIPLDTRIENSAAIYFDFNEPVITNTVFHTIGTDFIRSATAVFQPDAQAANWKLMPNPAREEAWLVLEKAEPGLKTVWLYDAFGRQVLRRPFDGERCRLPLTGMTPGWYALQLTDAVGRSLGAGRLVVR